MAVLVRSRGWRRSSICLLSVLLIAPQAGMFGQSADEDEVKAAFLVNFTKFVDWPQAMSPLIVCLQADDAFNLSVGQLVRKTANVRAIQVRKLSDPGEAKLCQIVFVSWKERSKAARVFETVLGKPVLTVGDGREFAAMGAIICLYSWNNNRISIAVNPVRAEGAGLKVSAKLMSLAQLIQDDRISDK